MSHGRSTTVIPIRVSDALAGKVRALAVAKGVSVNEMLAKSLVDVVDGKAGHVEVTGQLPKELDERLHQRAVEKGVAVEKLLEKAVRELLRPHKGKKS